MKKTLYIVLLFLIFQVTCAGLKRYTVSVSRNKVEFVSFAPQETIRASSNQLEGAVNWEQNIFTFSMSIKSFSGFNSPLQREHFNENYMESHIYPKATFQGKIIEQVDLSEHKKTKVRAKGKLTIHGIAKERIIDVYLTARGHEVEADADFSVKLDDYNIKIPRIVSEKLSPEIQVKVHVVLNE